jgi:hypothetical protein
MSDDQAVWGIDISPTRIAVAVYTTGGKHAKTYPLTNGPGQYTEIRDALIDVARSEWVWGEPTDVCIEQPALPFAKAAFWAGAACARTEDAVLGRWPHVVIRWMQPAEWRKIAGIGGRATKDEVKAWSHELGFAPEDQDQADASLIAYARYVELYEE